MVLGKLAIHMQKKLDLYLSPCIKANSKQIKDFLNVKPESVRGKHRQCPA